MRALFKYGYDKGRAGYPWSKRGVFHVSTEAAQP
jgi:hypothetical protein